MVATPIMHRGIKVELPQGKVDEVKSAQKQQDIVVEINYLDKKVDKKLQIYINSVPVSQDSLVEELKNLLNKINNRIYVQSQNTGEQ